VFLGEPPRSQGDFQFPIAGFNIRVTPWFWLATALLGIRNDDPRLVVVWVIAVFISIVIHELGHAFAFRYYGYNAHIVLYHFGGLAIPAGGRNVRLETAQGTGTILNDDAARVLLNNISIQEGSTGNTLNFNALLDATVDTLADFRVFGGHRDRQNDHDRDGA